MADAGYRYYHYCPTNPVLQKRNARCNGAVQTMKRFSDMTELNGAFLLPSGEGVYGIAVHQYAIVDLLTWRFDGYCGLENQVITVGRSRPV
jgi:hypothetical protein